MKKLLISMNHCTQCSWTGTNDELALKTYPGGGDDTLCPKCGGGVEETNLNVIANEKRSNKWLICKVDGRMESEELIELIKNEDFLKLYEKIDLDSEYFDYYKLKGIKLK